MKILYVSQYFPPENCAPAARVAELSKIWAEAGHDVTVLTGFPHHPTGKVPEEYRRKLRLLSMRDDRNGFKVRRTWLLPLPNRKGWERMLTYASFCISAIARGLFLPRPDIIIATSPQLLVGLAGLIIARAKRVKFLFEVRDLWPESLQAVGVSNDKSLLFKILGRVASMLYHAADHIVVVTNPFKEHLISQWGISKEKISVIINGVDEKLFYPREARSEMLRELNLEDRFVVGYIGTLGNAHVPEVLVSVAEITRKRDPKVVFLVVGEGAEKANFTTLVTKGGLENVRIYSARPRLEVPSIIACAQICLVTLRKSDVFKTVIPTKILEFMACGRPVVAAVEGEAANLIQRAGAGVCTPPEDAEALAEAILRLRKGPNLISEFSRNARRFVETSLTRDQTGKEYLNVIGDIAQDASVGFEHKNPQQIR